MTPAWPERFAERTRRMRRSEVRELLKLTEHTDVISFGGGLPASAAFPVARIEAACRTVLREHAAQALQYGATEGYRPLRALIVRHVQRYGLRVTPDNVLITSGSQQALDLVGRIFINPGDPVLVEHPTYLGAIQAWGGYEARFIPAAIDTDGVRIDQLEAGLRAGPKFVYALPNFQNPSGVTMSLERRRQLVMLADRYGVPVLEDDPYGQLRYEGEHLPPILALDAALRPTGGERYSGSVIYLSTFSKTLAPGLRLGWIVAPAEVIDRLIQAKQGADLHTSTFTQMVVHEVARDGFLDDHVRAIRSLYRERRDAMLAAMSECFPPTVTWTRPLGGLFIWVRWPDEIDAEVLLHEALEAKVAFLRGSAFYVDGSGGNMARFNFSNADVEHIREGIARIGRLLRRMMRAPKTRDEGRMAGVES